MNHTVTQRGFNRIQFERIRAKEGDFFIPISKGNLMIKRFNSLSHTVTGILLLVLTLVLFFNPPTAYADLADEIEAAFQTAIQGMVGTEFTNDSVTFDFEGVEVTFTVIGFALCEPSDPYAPPILNPIPPLNVYECENVTTVGADVANDESSASVLIEFNPIFLMVSSYLAKSISLCPINRQSIVWVTVSLLAP